MCRTYERSGTLFNFPSSSALPTIHSPTFQWNIRSSSHLVKVWLLARLSSSYSSLAPTICILAFIRTAHVHMPLCVSLCWRQTSTRQILLIWRPSINVTFLVSLSWAALLLHLHGKGALFQTHNILSLSQILLLFSLTSLTDLIYHYCKFQLAKLVA